MNEGVVEGSEDVTHAKYVFGWFSSTGDGGTEVGNLLFLSFVTFAFSALLLVSLACSL